MKIIRHDIEGVVEIIPRQFGDGRGFFSETYNQREFSGRVADLHFVQDNHSLSRDPYVIRGLHFQTPPHAQDKLVRVVRGRIVDVAVDIRHGSPSFGQHVMVELSAEKWNQLLVPKGFAHGFCTLEPDTEVLYKVTDYYAPDCDAGIIWNDPDINIQWPLPDGVEPVLSAKDQKNPRLAQCEKYFVHED